VLLQTLDTFVKALDKIHAVGVLCLRQVMPHLSYATHCRALASPSLGAGVLGWMLCVGVRWVGRWLGASAVPEHSELWLRDV
jgi:hypothetical protein